MKMTRNESFERELPNGYRQALYINAKETKFGIIFNLIAFAVLIVVMAAAFFALKLGGGLRADIFDMDLPQLILAEVVFIGSMLGYIVLHELVHGIAYKALTKEKLTFGISWSCAFCGVPSIYTYRRTALIAVIAPFAVFTLLLVPIIALLYYLNPLYYLMVAFIFGLHLGGCSGDLYVTLLLLTKFKDKRVLMRDTGPEQFFYVPEGER